MKLKDVLDLTKFKIALANTFSAIAGYSLGGKFDVKTIYVFFGIFFLAGGASAINEILEKGEDLLIPRTKNRPLPSGKITEKQAWSVAVAFFLLGSILLFLADIKSLSAGILAFVIYSFIYTPLKKITPLSLFVGAIVGALPPWAGYFAKSEKITEEIILLSLFMYLYQIPHTLSLLYIYKKEMEKSRFKTFAYLRDEKLKNFILITLVFSIASGIYYTWQINEILSVFFLIFGAVMFIRVINNTRKIFSDLNMFMLLIILSTIITKHL